MLAQARALRLPPADADVHVVAFREDPRVAARHDTQVDDRPAAPALLARVAVIHVPLERDAVTPLRAQAERPGRDPVDAVRPDHDRRGRRRAVEPDGRLLLPQLERSGTYPVAEVGTRGGRLLGEMSVEPPPLRHQHERAVALALEAMPVAQAELEAVDHVLDHRLDRDRQLAHCPVGQPPAAGLVAREARPVEQQHPRAAAGQTNRRRRAGGPGPDDDRVEPFHARHRTVEETRPAQ